jgi:ech hydrogenase subunit D
MLAELKTIEPHSVVNEVAVLLREGYRFVTMTCIDAGDTYEVTYHFDRQYQMRHLRLSLPKGASLPSVSGVCFAAALIENEIQDMFGIVVVGLAIDYKGRFLLAEDAPQTPMNKNCGMQVEVRVRTPAERSTPA